MSEDKCPRADPAAAIPAAAVTPRLPKPPHGREQFVIPVPLYGAAAHLQLPCDMTEAEAQKIANVVLAFAHVTSRSARPLS